MKIEKIVLNNFRAFKYAEIDFNDFNCIIGKNDSGKSTIIAALEWFFDTKKELSENDFAAANFDYYLNEHPSYIDEITGATYPGETIKEFIYDNFIISVDIYISGEIIPECSETHDFIFPKDFINENDCICISKYMVHPLSKNQGGTIGYSIKKYFFKPIGKSFTECSFEELKNAYTKIGKDTNKLCDELNTLEKSLKGKSGLSQAAIHSSIRNEEKRISKIVCDELYNHYEKISCKRECGWLGFYNDDEHSSPFALDFPEFKLYTSKTPIKEYLNELFTPNNYRYVEKLKERTAQKLSELLCLNNETEKLNYKKDERIDLFTEDSLEFSIKDLPLNIPLKNRGEGLQLQIKNAVFRLLSEIRSKNHSGIIFAFEEPETHLHPTAQVEMYDTIKKLSENPNYQVFITTHSPYIVKELSKANTPIVVKRDEKKNVSTASKLEGKVLPYVSMNEMNYIAFDEPTIEYHIELYGFIQQKQNCSIDGVDKWLFQNCNVERAYDFYFVDTKKGQLRPDKNGGYQHSNKTLPYCVRNQIDHPLDINKQYEERCVIRESIEIMRKAIIDNNLR